MRSTGEVMGIDASFGLAFAKSQTAAGNPLPAAGTVFFSLADRDKPAGIAGGPAASPTSGFSLVATEGTAAHLAAPRRPGRHGGGQARPARAAMPAAASQAKPRPGSTR